MSVAVVIPLYNHAPYIAAALTSVQQQSLRVDRIFVIDDGSTDDSVRIVQGISDPRVTLVSQENAGAHLALQRGMHLADAFDYVAVLNSDDLYAPERIERCIGYLEAHPELDVVCTALRLIDGSGHNLAPDTPKVRWLNKVWAARKEELAEWLGFANFAKTSSNLVGRADYFRRHPFRDYRYVHDYHFAVTCALAGRLGLVEERLLFYRTHDTNTIKADGLEKVTREVLRMNFDLLREHASALAADPEVRRRYALYFRELVQNRSDFRAEAFLAALAPHLPIWIEVGAFPELKVKSTEKAAPAPAEPAAKTLSPASDTRRRAKWLQLGAKLRLIPPDESPESKRNP